METSHLRPSSASVLLTLGLATSILLYIPGLSGGFFFDDAWNILANGKLQLTELSFDNLLDAALSGQAGPLKRPLSTISFAINHYFSGLSPFWYKLTNVAIHLLTAIAVYFFSATLIMAYTQSRQLQPERINARMIGAIAAVIWLLHPLNVSSVLYITQRMTILATLFTVAALYLYTSGRARQINGKAGLTRILSSLLVFAPLAIASKEIGLLIPAYLTVIEITILRFRAKDDRTIKGVYLLHTITFLTPLAAACIYILLHPEFILDTYTLRDFTLSERLYTEARVFWTYVGLIILPTPSSLGLFHDDITISAGISDPISTLTAVIALSCLAISALFLVARNKHPLISFGILFFIAGHSMESTFFGLEIAHEHRNYLPQLAIILPASYYLYTLCRPERLRIAGFTATAAVLIGLSTITLIRTSSWSNDIKFSFAQVEHHPNSPRANYQMGRIYASLSKTGSTSQNRFEFLNRAEKYFLKSATLRDNYTDGLFGLLVLQSSNGITLNHSYLSMLTYRLENESFAANNISQIRNLVKCRFDGVCNIPDPVIQKIFGAALANPTLSGRRKTLILRTIDRYNRASHAQKAGI